MIGRIFSQSRQRAGNIFAMLFGGVALMGVLGVSMMNLVIGPATTVTKVTHQNMAENDLLMNAKVAVMNAATLANYGDSDNDGYVEPGPFVPTSEASCAITLPGEGGCLPADIGAILTDPWGTQYAYCVWDHGETNSSANRINGEDSTSGAVLAILSAGPDKQFETPCNAYDGDPETNDTAITPNGIGDDLVQIYTYAAATAGSGGLWELKKGEPTTARIAKDIEVEGAFRMGTAGEDEGQVGLDSCTDMNHLGRMRFNPIDNAIEVCSFDDGYGWETIAAAGGSVPVGTIAAFDGESCPDNWEAVTGLQGRMVMGAGGGYSVGDTGGVATVALTIPQMPTHLHSVDPPSTGTSVAGNHSHHVNDPGHAHNIGYNIPLRVNDTDRGAGNSSVFSLDNAVQPNTAASATGIYLSAAGNHAHTVDIGPFASGTSGGGLPHENRPPYRVYLYCAYMGGGDGAVAESINDLTDIDTTGAQDNDILVWNEGAGQWLPEGQWVKDGTDLFYEGGNVGIGTDDPGGALDVAENGNLIRISKNSGSPRMTFRHADFDTRWTIDAFRSPTDDDPIPSDADFRVFSSDNDNGLTGTVHLTITRLGKVGIGTSSTNPLQELHVANGNENGGGNQTVAQFGVGPGSLFLTHNASYISNNLRYDDGHWRYEADGSGTAIGLGYGNGDISFSNVETGNSGEVVTNFTQRMVIRRNGNVGIGTNDPLSPLEIVFDNRASGIANDTIIRRPENTADWSPITFIRSRGTLTSPSPVQYGDALGGLLDHVVLVGSDRNGTSTAGYTTVYTGNGTTNLSTMNLFTSNKTGIFITDGATPTRVRIPAADGSSIMEDWPASWGGGLATWDIVGSSTYFGAYLTRSDRRYKEKIELIDQEAALDQLMNLKPVTYVYKDGFGPKGWQYGLIAQDVRKVIPDLVTGEEAPGNKLGLNYQGLIAPIIAVLQELKAQFDGLLERLYQLAERVDSLEASDTDQDDRIAELEAQNQELHATNENFRRELDELKAAICD